MDENFIMLKELIETKINGLASKLDLNYELLENKIDDSDELRSEISNNILTQVTKINDRVTKLEEIEHDHAANCPRISEIKVITDKTKELDDNLIEVKMIRKYPIISIIIIAVLVLGFLTGSGLVVSNKFDKKFEELSKQVTEMSKDIKK